MPNSLDQLTQTLKTHNHSLTRPRKLVFLSLLNQEPVTMGELIANLKEQIDRASIYRVIALYEKLGIVERLQIGWKYKLELSDSFASHHHHLACIQCGRIQAFEESPTLEFELKQLAAEAGFTETGHQLEIRGFCDNCKV